MYPPDGLLTFEDAKQNHDVEVEPYIIESDPFLSDDCLDVLPTLDLFLLTTTEELNMNTSENEPSSGLNGRLRPRKTHTPSPQNKAKPKSEGSIAQDKPKRTSTPSKASPNKQNDLANKSDFSPTSQFLCPYCDKKFASKQTVSKHVRRMHFSTSKQDTFLGCLFCNHKEADSNVIRHMVDNHPNQYFACLDCHARFPSTTELAEHKLNVCEKQKVNFRPKLRQKVGHRVNKKLKKSLNTDEKDDKDVHGRLGFNGIVISCELKPSQVHDGADIEDNITTNLILPPSKSLGNSNVHEKSAVIVLDDIQWNKRIPPNFSFHNTDADQILSRLGVVHRSSRTGESTRKDWFKTIDDTTQKFEKCFDTTFYSKVASNVQENLNKFLDGSFNFNPDPDSTIKTRKSKNSVVINTAEGFPILLASEQYSRSVFDSYLPRALAPKHKWKWENLESDRSLVNPDQIKRDSHTNNCIITLISSLDIWTQLSMRRKFDDKFNKQPLGKKTEKQNIISKELKDILESREIPTSSQTVVRVTKPIPSTNALDFPASLGLAPAPPTYDIQPAVLSGEWVRPRCYVCCACGEHTNDPKGLSSHISTQHPNAYVQHYEIVGEPLLNADILKHLYVPPSQVCNRTRPPRGFRECTKCKKSITLDDLHQHMLDCAGDTPTVRRRQCRSRPFGVRRRRPRMPDNTIRKKMRKDIRSRQRRQKTHMRPRPRIRTEVGDAETIRKMIADLPAKRHRVVINPMNMLPRQRRQLDKQRSLVLKKCSMEEGNDRKKSAVKGNLIDRKVKRANVDDNKNCSNFEDDEDNKPLKPKLKSIITKKTRQRESLKRQPVISRAKRKSVRVEQKNITEDIGNTINSSSSTSIAFFDDTPQRMDLKRGSYNTREHANRGASNNRDEQRPGCSGTNGTANNSCTPTQNVPLKHSIARLTADSETHDKSVQFHHSFLVQQECNNTNQHVPSGQQPLFENEAVVTRLDKPPLIYCPRGLLDLNAFQKNKLNKPRKGLNDCIAMLKNKLVEPVSFEGTGHVSVQCGSDEPIDMEPRPIAPATVNVDVSKMADLQPQKSTKIVKSSNPMEYHYFQGNLQLQSKPLQASSEKKKQTDILVNNKLSKEKLVPIADSEVNIENKIIQSSTSSRADKSITKSRLRLSSSRQTIKTVNELDKLRPIDVYNNSDATKIEIPAILSELNVQPVKTYSTTDVIGMEAQAVPNELKSRSGDVYSKSKAIRMEAHNMASNELKAQSVNAYTKNYAMRMEAQLSSELKAQSTEPYSTNHAVGMDAQLPSELKARSIQAYTKGDAIRMEANMTPSEFKTRSVDGFTKRNAIRQETQVVQNELKTRQMNTHTKSDAIRAEAHAVPSERKIKSVDVYTKSNTMRIETHAVPSELKTRSVDVYINSDTIRPEAHVLSSEFKGRSVNLYNKTDVVNTNAPIAPNELNRSPIDMYTINDAVRLEAASSELSPDWLKPIEAVALKSAMAEQNVCEPRPSNLYRQNSSFQKPVDNCIDKSDPQTSVEVFCDKILTDIPVAIPPAHASTNVDSIISAPLDLSSKMLGARNSNSFHNTEGFMLDYDNCETLDLSNKNAGKIAGLETIAEDNVVVDLRIRPPPSRSPPSTLDLCVNSTINLTSHVSDMSMSVHEVDSFPTDLSIRGHEPSMLDLSDKAHNIDMVHDLSSAKTGFSQREQRNVTATRGKASATPSENVEKCSEHQSMKVRLITQDKIRCNSLTEPGSTDSLLNIALGSDEFTEKASLQKRNDPYLQSTSGVDQDFSNTRIELPRLLEHKSQEKNASTTQQVEYIDTAAVKAQKPVYDQTFKIHQYKMQDNVKETATFGFTDEKLDGVTTNIVSHSSQTSKSSVVTKNSGNHDFFSNVEKTATSTVAGSGTSLRDLSSRALASPISVTENPKSVYTSTRACISDNIIESVVSISLANTVPTISGSKIASTPAANTRITTTIDLPVKTCATEKESLNNSSPSRNNSPTTFQGTEVGAQKINEKMLNEGHKQDFSTQEQDPETARKIAMLPKALVDILGNMPIDHRNQLLNVLPQFVSTAGVAATSCDTAEAMPETILPASRNNVSPANNDEIMMTNKKESSYESPNVSSISNATPSKLCHFSNTPVPTALVTEKTNLANDHTISRNTVPVSIDSSLGNSKKTSEDVIPTMSFCNNVVETKATDPPFGIVTNTNKVLNYESSSDRVIDLTEDEASSLNLNAAKDVSNKIKFSASEMIACSALEKQNKPKKNNDKTASLRAVRIKAPSERQKENQMRVSVEKTSAQDLTKTDDNEVNKSSESNKTLAIQQAEISSTQQSNKTVAADSKYIAESLVSDFEPCVDNSSTKSRRASTPIIIEVEKDKRIKTGLVTSSNTSSNSINKSPNLSNDMPKEISNVTTIESIKNQSGSDDHDEPIAINPTLKRNIAENIFHEEEDSEDDIILAAIVKRKQNSEQKNNISSQDNKKKPESKKKKKEKKFKKTVPTYKGVKVRQTENIKIIQKIEIDLNTESCISNSNEDKKSTEINKQKYMKNVAKDIINKENDVALDTVQQQNETVTSIDDTKRNAMFERHDIDTENITQGPEITEMNTKEIGNSSCTKLQENLSTKSLLIQKQSKNIKKKEKFKKKKPPISLKTDTVKKDIYIQSLDDMPRDIADEAMKIMIATDDETNRDTHTFDDNDVSKQENMNDLEKEKLEISSDPKKSLKDIFEVGDKTDLQLCREIDKNDSVPLRRSRRGKSLFIDSTSAEHEILNTSILDQKIPLTKKQLIFSKLLLDEEIHTKSLNLEKEVNTIKSGELSKCDDDPIDFVSHNSNKTTIIESSAQECKSAKRKKSPQPKSKIKQKKSTEMSQCPENNIITDDSLSDGKEVSKHISEIVNSPQVESNQYLEVKEDSLDENMSTVNISNENIKNQKFGGIKQNSTNLNINEDTLPENNNVQSSVNKTGPTEKRKITDVITSLDSSNSSKPKKTKFNKSHDDGDISNINEELKTDTLNKHSELESAASRATTCYNASIAARTTRSKSVVLKPFSGDSYDPYDIDLDEMIEKDAALKRSTPKSKNLKIRPKNVKKFIKNAEEVSDIGILKNNGKKNKSLMPVTTEVNPDVSQSLIAKCEKNSYSTEVITKVCKDSSLQAVKNTEISVKDNMSDSDDSSKSDVPLTKYLEEKAKKMEVDNIREASTSLVSHDLIKCNNDNNEQRKKNKLNPSATRNVEKVKTLDKNEEQLRSEQFMESFGFFSERKPRKSNLLATKKISETFHISKESDDLYFGTKERIAKKPPQSENKKSVDYDNNTQSSLSKQNLKRGRKKKVEKIIPPYCIVCSKEFRRIDNYLRHQMTMLHIAKLSESLKFKTEPYPEEPNYLIVFKQKLDQLVILREKLTKERRKKNSKKKIVLPTLDDILAEVNRHFERPKVQSRGLSRDEALFIDCCELLKESHKIEVPAPEAVAMSNNISTFNQPGPSSSNFDQPGQSSSNYNHPGPSSRSFDQQGPSSSNFDQQGPSSSNFDQQGPSLSNFDQQGPSLSNFEQQGQLSDPALIYLNKAVEKSDSKSDGDVDSITAKTILESEEVRNLENDLISGLKEAANQNTSSKTLDYHQKVCNILDSRESGSDTFSSPRIESHCTKIKTIDDDFDVPIEPELNKNKKHLETKDKMYPDVENIDMFEDKFDKIKRKCRSQAAAAKQVQIVTKPASEHKGRKRSDKKKGKKSSKKNYQNTVLTKGALKGFDGIKVSIPTSDINMSAIVPLHDSAPKKRKKTSSRKRREKRSSETSSKYDSDHRFKDTTQKKVDVYEFMDNEDAELFEFRPSTLMERFKSISTKEMPSTTKHDSTAEEPDNSSESASDGDDFVYMSDDYVCSDDETEDSIMSYETGNVKNDTRKTLLLKRKDVVEKNAVMGKIFKHNAVRSEKKSPIKSKEITKPKANLDQLFDSLLEKELDSSMLNNNTDSLTQEEIDCLEVHDQNLKKLMPISEKRNLLNKDDSKTIMDEYEFSTSKEENASFEMYGPSTSKRYEMLLPKDCKAPTPKKHDKSSSKKYDASTRYLDSPPLQDYHQIPEVKDKLSKELPLTNLYECNAEFDDDTGVARQRARRKCTVGKQNVLAETWSSESEPDDIPPRPNSAESVVAGASRKKKCKKKDSQNSLGRRGKIMFKKQDNESRVNSSTSNNGAGGHSSASTRVASGVNERSGVTETAAVDTCAEPVAGPSGCQGATSGTAIHGSKVRPRSAAYYWSSEGDEEQEHLQQHGWIVGDSHKKLVTMLAHAKGRKRNNDDKRHLVE